MAKRKPLDVESELIEAFVTSGRVSEYLVSIMPDSVWKATTEGRPARSIRAIVAHMQSVRRTHARMGGAVPGPPPLDRHRSTRLQAERALRNSTDTLAALFREAIAARQVRVRGMPRRVVNMLTFLIQHDAHHRGQICTLAKELGHQFTQDDIMRMWGWKKLP